MVASVARIGWDELLIFVMYKANLDKVFGVLLSQLKNTKETLKWENLHGQQKEAY